MNSTFTVENYTISRSSMPFLVAEIGLNHNNDLEIGQRTIEAAKKAGVNAVKFQSYITEEFIDSSNPEVKFLFDIFKEYELSESMHRKFQQTAKDLGLIFFSTPLCDSSVDMLESLGVSLYKIASGDIVNYSLLKKVVSTKKPIFISSGAADLHEVARAMNLLHDEQARNICLMHCVSLYPTPLDKLNLRTISTYRELYDCPIGFSDHSSGSIASVVSVSLGATVIEKHFTLDKSLTGPDHTISVNPEELKRLRNEIDEAYNSLGDKKKIPHPEEVSGRFYGRRSAYFRENRILPLRPALHLKDQTVIDSWEIEKIQNKNMSRNEGPVRLNHID